MSVHLNIVDQFVYDTFVYDKIFFKMGAGGHFECPKLIFVCISGHFRSKRNFNFFLKMAAGGHFGCQKFIFVCISHLFSPFLFAFHYLRCIMNLPMRNGEHEVKVG